MNAPTVSLKVAIVDDEPLARMRIRTLLGQSATPNAVVGEFGESVSALMWLQEQDQAGCSPDLVVLDIQMPGLDGMVLAARLRDLRRPPSVVFVTAHAEHALRAFDLAAAVGQSRRRDRAGRLRLARRGGCPHLRIAAGQVDGHHRTAIAGAGRGRQGERAHPCIERLCHDRALRRRRLRRAPLCGGRDIGAGCRAGRRLQRVAAGFIRVIASHRVGARRRPTTGSAKQSGLAATKLDCFVASAPRNDGWKFLRRVFLIERIGENLAGIILLLRREELIDLRIGPLQLVARVV